MRINLKSTEEEGPRVDIWWYSGHQNTRICHKTVNSVRINDKSSQEEGFRVHMWCVLLSQKYLKIVWKRLISQYVCRVFEVIM